MKNVFFVAVLLVFAGMIYWQGEVSKDEQLGQPRIIDGDSLEFSDKSVRLKGIDAPEGRQKCQRGGEPWACGRASHQALSVLIGRKAVRCEGHEYDKYNRLLAICYVAGKELNAAMVREGWAVSYGGAYLEEELAAKSAKRGIWASEFERPVDWRASHGR